MVRLTMHVTPKGGARITQDEIGRIAAENIERVTGTAIPGERRATL